MLRLKETTTNDKLDLNCCPLTVLSICGRGGGLSLGKVTRCDIMYIRAFNEGLNVGGRRSRDSLATAHQQGEDTG